MNINGKVALVTGAGQGVGRGIALALAAGGALVILVGRTTAKLQAVRAEIEAAGGEADVAHPADVRHAADIDALITYAADRYGGIDILVNSAQQAVLAPLLDIDDEGLLLTFESGPFAAFRMMKAAHPYMKQRGGGAIINIVSSTAINWDTSGTAAYSAAKQAIGAITRAAASEWGPDGIRVNNIAPLAGSPAMLAWLDAKPEGPDAYLSTIPLRRIGDPQADIGRAVLFLASDEAAYITGATIPVDGGQANWN
ncbi:SDR family oxidoreductase [Sphingomonadales bacterium 56]|uniref:SDR family NAD(P)-dependent oxidoreductase n=1 Tax=unclassified Sphingobium TaxID=2611147 RepID=UPI00191A780F|nr:MULTISPECIES: SDR family oxidoreductase [unclassified Sphingobium]MBY2930487.1 SDR family oxidoreductase [Sphingomonadales bacterium 56]MBY2960499.1 SDR family oxidoreductase [Sphingomonadales bacterium 58]CAD7341325.1 Oxidoreductase UcpA [Sphingobium sp. S8]CAD7341406.1 Oxidoreductase UcpA [Sphingobium sp. S6]